MRRRSTSGDDRGGPRAAPPRGFEHTSNGSGVLGWLDLAQGTTREALAERLAQAHLIDSEFLPVEFQGVPTGTGERAPEER